MATIIIRELASLDAERLQLDQATLDSLKKDFAEALKTAKERKGSNHQGQQLPAELFIVGVTHLPVIPTNADGSYDSTRKIQSATVFQWSTTKGGKPVGHLFWRQLVCRKVSELADNLGEFVGADGTANDAIRAIDLNPDLTEEEKEKEVMKVLKDKKLSNKTSVWGYTQAGNPRYAYTLDFA